MGRILLAAVALLFLGAMWPLWSITWSVVSVWLPWRIYEEVTLRQHWRQRRRDHRAGLPLRFLGGAHRYAREHLQFVSGSGKNRTTHEAILWQHCAAAHNEPGSRGTRLIFRFDVPDGLHPSDAVREGSKYCLWRLNRKASMPGIDISRDYEIPVYPTRQGSARIAGRAVDASQHATLKMQR
jgi:hypothetical protein